LKGIGIREKSKQTKSISEMNIFTMFCLFNKWVVVS